MQRRLWLRSTGVLLCASRESSTPAEGDGGASEPASQTPPKSLIETIEGLSFRHQLVELKRSTRGVAQRPQNLANARVVIDRCIPASRSELDAWLTEENATTALNAATFYEVDIPHQDCIVQWTAENVTKFNAPFNIASAGISLQQLFREDDDMLSRLRETLVPMLRDKLSELHGDSFHSAVRLFQRLRVSDEALWKAVCDEIKAREVTIARKESVAVRLFSCIARHAPENDVTRELFGFLLQRVDGMKSYDFSTFLSGAERWGHLSVDDALPLLRRQGERTHYNNARDLGVCFPACVRIAKKLMDAQCLAEESQLAVVQHLRFVFDACETHLARCMDPAQPNFYWRKPTDIVQALYAYESSNQRPPTLFDAFTSYVAAQAPEMSARDIAMTFGILRRAGRVSADIVALHQQRIEECLAASEFTLEEASHIALTFAVVGGNAKTPKALDTYVTKHWKKAEEPAAAVPFGSHPHARHFTALNMSAVHSNKLYSDYDVQLVTVRQLCDVRDAATQTKTKSHVNAELRRRLQGVDLTPGDLVIVARGASKPDDELRRPAQTAVTALLNADSWGPYHIQLLSASTKLDRSEYADKAIALGRKLAVSPQQLVSVLEVLVPLFLEHPGLKELVADGLQLLARGSVSYSVRAAKLLANTPLSADGSWYRMVVCGPAARRARRVKVSELTKLLHLAKAGGGMELTGDDDGQRLRRSLGFIVEGAVAQVEEGTVSQPEMAAFADAVSAIDSELVTDALRKAVETAVPAVSHSEPAKRRSPTAGTKTAEGKAKSPAKKPAAEKKPAKKPAPKASKSKKPAAKGKGK